MTVGDLDKKIQDDQRFRTNAMRVGKDGGGGGDSERWGIRALDLTN